MSMSKKKLPITAKSVLGVVSGVYWMGKTVSDLKSTVLLFAGVLKQAFGRGRKESAESPKTAAFRIWSPFAGQYDGPDGSPIRVLDTALVPGFSSKPNPVRGLYFDGDDFALLLGQTFPRGRIDEMASGTNSERLVFAFGFIFAMLAASWLTSQGRILYASACLSPAFLFGVLALKRDLFFRTITDGVLYDFRLYYERFGLASWLRLGK